MNACRACGGYVFRGSRHRTCAPSYRRARLVPCEVCGKAARGRRHRACGELPAGFRHCAYCGDLSRGEYHKACQPDHYEYRVFGDMPDVVQRRCIGCQEWFPFASIGPSPETIAIEWWSPHGISAAGRPVYDGRCRACRAVLREKWRAA